MLTWVQKFCISKATSTSQSNDTAPSGVNDGPAAATVEPDSSQANQPEKADTSSSQSNAAAPSGGKDGPAAADSSQANQP
jgi:hypothetical protein